MHLLAVALTGVFVLECASARHHHQDRTKNSNDDFDMIVFAQQWPESVCIEGHLTHHYACSIARNISTWTVHGMWPTLNGTLGPNYCDDSKKFQPGPVLPLLSQLTEYWPNLHTDQSFYSFWTHEWDKHGTCAQSLPSMSGEYNYFKMGILLNKRYNILEMLNKAQINPNADGYTFSEFSAAFKSVLGAEPSYSCFYEKKYGAQYLMQIDICLDKTFAVVDCKRSSGGCIDSKPMLYPPIKHPYLH